ncbi:MAG: hypothetical protein SH847_06875 [Roseiflexaceae bacterium]|nr:hypothetical protein [Roseiflexaceae bacterium]
MSTTTDIRVDNQGRLVLSTRLAHLLGLVHGMTLVVEEETPDATYMRIQKPHTPYIEKQGVFVIPAQLGAFTSDYVSDVREQRLDDLWSDHARSA